MEDIKGDLSDWLHQVIKYTLPGIKGKGEEKMRGSVLKKNEAYIPNSLQPESSSHKVQFEMSRKSMASLLSLPCWPSQMHGHIDCYMCLCSQPEA